MNQNNYIIETDSIPQQMSPLYSAERITQGFRNYMMILKEIEVVLSPGHILWLCKELRIALAL